MTSTQKSLGSRFAATAVLAGGMMMTVAGAVASTCWIDAGSTSCCLLTAGFDPTGNCSPWFHTCPDSPITNPAAGLSVAASVGGKRTTTILPCVYTNYQCAFIGCKNAGVVNASCASDTVSGTCDKGGGGVE